jgi:hypothetical protein
LYRDCCNPGEIELREKEKGQISEFVRKVRAGQTWKKLVVKILFIQRNLSDSFLKNKDSQITSALDCQLPVTVIFIEFEYIVPLITVFMVTVYFPGDL